MAKKTFNLYLAKEGVADFAELLSEAAREKIGTPAVTIYNINFAEAASLFVFSDLQRKPQWARQLEGAFDVQINAISQSACAILAFRQNGRLFASTFSFGWMYLDERALIRDFGLRTAINALDNTKLKRLERTNLADALRDSALSPFQRDFNSFGIDDALELVRSLSGSTIEGVEASSITGSSSLKWTSDRELAELDLIASEAFHLFNSDAYQETPFAILDILRPVVDLALVDDLNEQLVQSLRNRSGNFELGMPVPIGDEDVSYWFQGLSGRRSYEDLLVENYLSLLGDDLENIVIRQIKDQRIIARLHSVEGRTTSASLFTSLVGSINFDGQLYALNDGLWYEVEQAFKQSIEQMFVDAVEDWEYEPKPFIKKVSPNGRRATYEREELYNARIAQELGFYCLDGNLVANPNFARSQIEFCDILDLDGRRFIHVKKNSRKSPILSHLFKQGSNSAQNFKYFESFRNEAREVLRDAYDDDAVNRFDNAIDSDENWAVEFWIADSQRAAGGFNIPFFSKITLRDEHRLLRSMEFDVVIRFIELPTPAAG